LGKITTLQWLQCLVVVFGWRVVVAVVLVVVTQSVHVRIDRGINYLAKVSLSSNLLCLGVRFLLSFLGWILNIPILWKLVEATILTTSRCSKNLIICKILTAVIGWNLVGIIHLLLNLSLVVVGSNLGVIIKTSSQVTIL
jgi:hypothetical protein